MQPPYSLLLFEDGKGLIDFIYGAYLVQRKPHYPCLFSQSLENGLTNPPDCIGNELKSPCFVEALGSLDQSKIPFINKIW